MGVSFYTDMISHIIK